MSPCGRLLGLASRLGGSGLRGCGLGSRVARFFALLSEGAFDVEGFGHLGWVLVVIVVVIMRNVLFHHQAHLRWIHDRVEMTVYQFHSVCLVPIT